MAFSDIADYTTAVTGFGIKFNLDDGVDDVTVQVSDNDKFAPTWQPCLISCTDLTQELRFMDPVVKVSDFSWTIANVPLQYMQGAQSHDRADELFGNGFEWQGKEVVVYLLALNEVTGTIEEHAIWVGRIMECEYDEESITFEAEARAHWYLDKTFPNDTITKHDYPDTPDAVLGTQIPTLFGSFDGYYYATKLTAWNCVSERCGLEDHQEAQRHAVPLVCYDKNPDLAAGLGPSFLLASHLCHGSIDATALSRHLYQNIPGHDQLAIIADSTIAGTGFTGSNTAAGYTIKPHPGTAFSLHFHPFETESQSNATDPLKAANRSRDDYAVLDASHNILKLHIERPPDLGLIARVEVCALVSEIDWETGMRTRVGMYYDDANGDPVGWFPASDPYVETISSISGKTLSWRQNNIIDSPDLYHPNNFPDNLSLRCQLYDVTTASLRVHMICLVVYYEGTHMTTQEYRMRYNVLGQEIGMRPWGPAPYLAESDTFPEIGAGSQSLFATCNGMRDNAFGTYTGTANALIRIPCDIVHYLIYACGARPNSDADYVGYVPGDIETTRVDHAGFGLAQRIRIAKQTTYGKLIGDICRQSFSSLTCRWSANQELGVIWWGAGAADNLYGTDIAWDDVFHEREFAVSHSPVRFVRNALYFHLQHNHRLGKEDQLAFCTSADSDDGEGNDDYSNKADLADSVTQFGLWELHMRCPYAFERGSVLPVNARGQFEYVREHIARELIGTRVRVRFSLPWKYYDIQVGHVLEFDSEWQDHIHYPAHYGTAGSWTKVGNRRSFVVERMSFSADGYIELEVTELRRGAD